VSQFEHLLDAGARSAQHLDRGLATPSRSIARAPPEIVSEERQRRGHGMSVGRTGSAVNRSDVGVDPDPVGAAVFCDDTHGFLDYLIGEDQPLDRRDLSLLLLSTMFTAAGLDWFERGDVFARIAALRPGPAPQLHPRGLHGIGNLTKGSRLCRCQRVDHGDNGG
jgi:hypothetical protein